jgi:hypothetical protein
MPIVKQIVCLANSRKPGGTCIAGKELIGGRPVRWIRPVSSREKDGLLSREYQYDDRKEAQVLDIINIPLVEHRPREYQQENWLIDPEFYWKKVDSIIWADLKKHTDSVKTLWMNDFSTYNGLNDKIPERFFNVLKSSLCLILVDELTISVVVDYGRGGKIRVQGKFTHNEVEYRLWVTDWKYEREYEKKKEGEYRIGRCFLTISLGEPYQGACYKLIAAIIEPD